MAENIDHTKELEKQHEDPVTILKQKAEELKKNHRFEEAMELMSKVDDFENNRRPENFWNEIGLHLCNMGKYEDALECFDKDLEFNTTSFDAHYAKGVTLYSLARYDEALESFFKAHEINYSNTQSQSTLIENLKEHKKFEDALTQPKVEDRKLKEHRLWYYLAVTLYQLKRYDEALENFDRAAKTMADDASTFYDWAKCELMASDPEKCLELLQRACDLDSSNQRLLQIDPAFDQIRNNERFRILSGNTTNII